MRDAELQILLETLGTDDATARVIVQLFEKATQVEDLIRERGDLARQCERLIGERDVLRARAERLSAANEFSCERSPGDCECPGCTLAKSYAGDVDRLLADRADAAERKKA